MTGIYNSDGTIATTTVPGSSYTGLHAADGSINIVLNDASHTGVYHPCGALRVNSATGSTTYDPSGGYYSNTILGIRGIQNQVISPQAAAFIARTTGLSTPEQNAYITMINGMVTDNIWTKFDLLYIYATNTTTTALLNLVSTNFTATNTGGLTFTADQGFTGTGSVGGFVDTNWMPSTNAVQYTMNGGMTGSYIRSSRVTSNNMTAYGCNNVAGTSFSYFRGRNASNNIEAGVNDGTFGGFANANVQGSWILNRTSSTNVDVFKNAGATRLGNITATTVAMPDRNMQVFQLNNGAGQGPTTDQQAAFWAGGNFSSTDVSNLQARINTYMTAIGANVY